jgi:hypothetical protein
MGKHVVRSAISVNHALAGETVLTHVGLSFGGMSNSGLIAVAATCSKGHRVGVEFGTHSIVGNATVGLSRGSKGVRISQILHTAINGGLNDIGHTLGNATAHRLDEQIIGSNDGHDNSEDLFQFKLQHILFFSWRVYWLGLIFFFILDIRLYFFLG